MIIHILISISHSAAPNIIITALNTYVIPFLHHILTTQFIYTYSNITKNHHQNHLNIKIFYPLTIIHKHIDLKYEHYHGITNVKVP
nr:CLL_HP1_G0000870.mRNA.1.CDS.1 [Saccharomyces cerevisiae]